MSAAPGTEALDVESYVEVAPTPAPRRPAALRPVRPSPPASVRLPAGRSPLGAWLQALRAARLPSLLLGPAVALLLALAEPSVRPGAAVVALAGVLALHGLHALLRALGDDRRHRAGPLRRAEAGRAVLGVVAAGLALTVGLTLLAGWPALLLAAGGVAVVVVAVRAAVTGSAAVTACVAPVSSALAAVALWWSATGTLPWRVVVAAAVAGALVAALRTTSSSRALLAAPCAAAGVAVALHALPWPVLLVAASLPVARSSALAGRPASAAARLAVVLVLAGLVLALATGADLPLTAPR